VDDGGRGNDDDDDDFHRQYFSHFPSDFCSITYTVYINLHLLDADKNGHLFFFFLFVLKMSLNFEQFVDKNFCVKRTKSMILSVYQLVLMACS